MAFALIACLLVMGALIARFGALRAKAVEATRLAEGLRERDERYRALMANSSDAITVLADDTTLSDETLALERMLAYPPGGLVGRRFLDLVEGGDLAEMGVAFTRLANDPGRHSMAVDVHLTRADGKLLTAEVVITDQREDDRLGGYLLNVRDVSDRKKLEARIEHQAFHDHLTGLANRGLLEDRVEHAIARGQRTGSIVAIVFGDLDDFKAVNDTLGHAAGDELLVKVAERLKAQVRPGDTLSRLGGDEFAVLLEDLQSEEQAIAAAERLLDGMRAPFQIEGTEYFARSSLGVAFVDPDGPADLGERARQLLRDADVAMYEAKRRGHGLLEVFAPAMHEAAKGRLQMKNDLQHAVQREEFVVHYQPILNLEDDSLEGFEALARWEHPERGLIPPLEFIGVAEQSGLIVEIGGHVLREACRQMAAWGVDGYMSVNVTGQQLLRNDFVAEVTDALQIAGLAPERLLLEVTESALIVDTEASARRLNTLRKFGVRLAIDDFGTGYSSLNYLRELPMDVLKIDRSFVAEIAGDGRNAALVEAIIQMGSNMGLRIVAEGIEDAEQQSALTDLNCVTGQGFLFARPQPAAEVHRWLAERDEAGLTKLR